MISRLLILAAAGTLGLFSSNYTIESAQAAPVELTVNAQKFEPMPLAIPDFHGNNPQIAQRIRDVVVRNLENSGLFHIVPVESYLAKPALNSAPNFENWKPLGAASLIVGDVQLSGNQIHFSFRVWDVYGGQQITGQQFKGSTSILRRLGHKTSDVIYSALTGEGPYFDSQIVFIDESGSKNNKRKRLAVMDQDGQNVRYLTNRKEYILSPRYSAKAQRIVFTTLGRDGSALHLMDPSTGRREKLLSYPNRMVYAPSLSPDGEYVAMSVENIGNSDIYVYHIPSKRIYQVTSGYSIDTSPSFSPDGQMIVFNSDRGGSQQLYTVPTGGGQAMRISYGDGRYATPVWSPKGDKIAFTKMKSGKFSIGTMSVDGSHERILASSFLDEAPSWAPNGRSLIFFRQQAGSRGQSALYSVDISGYLPERRVPTPRDASDPSWSPLLP